MNLNRKNKLILIFLICLIYPICPINSEAQFTSPGSPTAISSPFKVKGIHITSWVAGSKNLFQKTLNLINETELNTVVIDIKEVDGIIAYDVDVPLAKEIKAVKRRIKNIDEIIALCDEYGLYKIARITVFKDNWLATKKPYLAVMDKSGKVWRDDKGQSWVNPYLKEVWKYNVDIAMDAIKRGFDEIQFDYVRFPSDGLISNCWYGEEHSTQKQADTIIEFIKFAKQTLGAAAFLSIDVFGLTTLCKNGIGIGQKFKQIAEYVDFISPMVYPSHYAKGSYGISNPDSQPYKTIFLSIKDANQQIKETNCKIRPWLQDFSLEYTYGAKEVRDQINALYAHGVDEWLLWNPGCKYTKNALLTEDNIRFVPHQILPKQFLESSPLLINLPLSYSVPNTFTLQPTLTLQDKCEISKESSTVTESGKREKVEMDKVRHE
ncbi:MAG: putative glycoside hydrolase [bacterium]